jgi:glyceraldehyde 3-phosphate dehydrogenase
MTIRVGINGFGRIGRMVFRAAQDFDDVEVVGINDLLEPEYLAYMLKYDSVHGRFKGDIAVDGNTLIVKGKKIRLTAERDPAELKWGELDVDVVIGAKAYRRRRQKSHHVGALEGRYADVRVRRQ